MFLFVYSAAITVTPQTKKCGITAFMDSYSYSMSHCRKTTSSGVSVFLI
jgi:hypothetical protein